MVNIDFHCMERKKNSQNIKSYRVTSEWVHFCVNCPFEGLVSSQWSTIVGFLLSNINVCRICAQYAISTYFTEYSLNFPTKANRCYTFCQNEVMTEIGLLVCGLFCDTGLAMHSGKLYQMSSIKKYLSHFPQFQCCHRCCFLGEESSIGKIISGFCNRHWE